MINKMVKEQKLLEKGNGKETSMWGNGNSVKDGTPKITTKTETSLESG